MSPVQCITAFNWVAGTKVLALFNALLAFFALQQIDRGLSQNGTRWCTWLVLNIKQTQMGLKENHTDFFMIQNMTLQVYTVVHNIYKKSQLHQISCSVCVTGAESYE